MCSCYHVSTAPQYGLPSFYPLRRFIHSNDILILEQIVVDGATYKFNGRTTVYYAIPISLEKNEVGLERASEIRTSFQPPEYESKR